MVIRLLLYQIQLGIISNASEEKRKNCKICCEACNVNERKKIN